CNKAFREVMLGCSKPRHKKDGTWITPAMIKAFCKLHAEGHAHSVEVWHAGELAGGIYGPAVGGGFGGGSMFRNGRDAAEVASPALVSHLNARGYQLFDIQQCTPHTGSMGAVEIDRSDYLALLKQLVDRPVTFGTELAPIFP